MNFLFEHHILSIVWRMISPIFNYLGLPFRYAFFFIIGKKRPISFLNRPNKEEPKDTWFNQKASNKFTGIVFVIIIITILVKKNIL